MSRPARAGKRLCETAVDRYFLYHPWGRGDEADFNLNIAPAGPFPDDGGQAHEMDEPAAADPGAVRPGGSGR
ncbi:hypothetical protein [Allorhizocola rhizosphaerae]|uniref:hypothetical protein n=1 Tax=Allorhizocola rhizosphaerae TaxID=1872709 RepID=UPI0013C2BA0D|nr:hypothetical protein [Allorhizocola rhizosphaerae]